MQALRLAFSPRFIVLTLAVLLTLVFLALIAAGAAPRANGFFWVGAVLFGALTLLGVHDLAQTRHAVLRNYPISAHLRFLLEEIRPEMRQYFFESETDGLPFSRSQRAIVYQRAKMVLDKRPFGTQRDTMRLRARARKGPRFLNRTRARTFADFFRPLASHSLHRVGRECPGAKMLSS